MLIDAQFDPELIRRYDISGPRYTSYPTAPQFRDDFGEAVYRHHALLSNLGEHPRKLSLYLHLPYCSSPCFYCGCTRLITRQRPVVEAYLKRLCREIELAAGLFDGGREVMQLHLGGGTPNLLDSAQLQTLMQTLERNFSLSRCEHREFGIEVDPRHADANSVRAMAEMGFNRISIGVQDFDSRVQVAVNRVQSLRQTQIVVETARAAGFRSVNLDLIYGLPKQSVDGFNRTLDDVVAMRPDRIATYSYAHLPRLFKAQRRIFDADIPGASDKLKLFECALRRLTQAGYHYVGMDHFARADDDLVTAQRAGNLQRNFQGYSTHADCDLIGLGLSAIGKIGDSYAQNAKDLLSYFAAIDDGRLPIARGIEVSRDDTIRRDLIGNLMCHGHVNIASFENVHAITFADYFAPERGRLRELQNDGLLAVTPEEILVTARGRFLMRIIAMTFDAYLPRSAVPTCYSRAI